MPKREKFILVLSVGKDYLHGAFPNTECGQEDAQKYIKKIKKEKKIKLYLKIK